VAVGKPGKDDNAQLWIYDAHGNAILLASEAGAAQGSPTWSPDGARIAFWDTRAGTFDLYARPANGAAGPQLLFKNEFSKYPTDWSRDGKYLLFGQVGSNTNGDVWGYSMPDRRAGPIVDTIHDEGHAALSPDGKWIAYQSDESKTVSVYVQEFNGITPGTKRRWRISPTGGGLPRWRADGQELFYLTCTGIMTAISIHPADGEFRFDGPKSLFATRSIPGTWNAFDVSPDGQRFLLNLPLEWNESAPASVITNAVENLVVRKK
jgi:Tol biopolymer transport system component